MATRSTKRWRLVDADLSDDRREAFAIYDVRGWRVELRDQVASPYDGPSSLRIAVVDAEGVDETLAVDTDGITLEVLRSVPLSDARSRLTALKRKARQDEGGDDLPARLETPEHWAAFAAAYVALVKAGRRHPVDELRASTGVSRNTLSARVRVARERGFLLGEPNKPADRLGPEAIKHLKNKGE